MSVSNRVGVPRPVLDERAETTLDPQDWEAMRRLGHRMVDDVIAMHRGIGDRPAWQAPSHEALAVMRAPLTADARAPDTVYDDVARHVLPYPYGNLHPRAWGWVNGTGTTIGAFAEMLAAAMNSNAWAGQQAATHVEATVLDWVKSVVSFPVEASGVLVSGGSTANLVCLAAARDDRAGAHASAAGLHGLPRLTMYASEQVHNSVDQAAGLLGLGWSGLRKVPVDSEFRMDVAALETAIRRDLANGVRPIAVAATAGTVNTGAIDPLDRIADVCERYGLWLHVDGAFGAMAALSPALRPLLAGIERADSIAIDLHKWLYAPIGVGCALVRDPDAHQRPFSPPATYLMKLDRGVASGPLNYSLRSPELTRPFRALKVWVALHTHGTSAYARLVEQNVRQARELETRIRAHPALELMAPVSLNVVCFRYNPSGIDAAALDALNTELLQRIQESGEAVPSSTRVRDAFVLRVAFTNHRTRWTDLDRFVEAIARIGTDVNGER